MPLAALEVTVVHAPACHLCQDAEVALAELATAFPLEITRVDVQSAEGAALVRAHRAPMYPLVLVERRMFSWGRLPRRKLRRLLEQRAAAAGG